MKPTLKKTILVHDTFGQLEFDDQGSATTTQPFGQGSVDVRVVFCDRGDYDRGLPPNAQEHIARLPGLPSLNRNARQILSTTLASHEKGKQYVKQYRSDLLEGIDAKVLAEYFGVAELRQLDDTQFVAGLRLAGVSIHIDFDLSDTPTTFCDYTIGDRLTNRFINVVDFSKGVVDVQFSVSGDDSVRSNTTKATKVLTHPTLGRLEFDEDGVANTTLRLGETSVPLDISFPDGERPTLKALARSGRRASELAKLDADARKAIAKDLALGEEGEVVHLYKTHHFEELDAATLAERFGVTELAQIDDARFIAGLELVRVGLYPKEPDATFVCDYTLGADLTDYIIAVTFDNRGRVRSLAMES